jgi:hypothetical protein
MLPHKCGEPHGLERRIYTAAKNSVRRPSASRGKKWPWRAEPESCILNTKMVLLGIIAIAVGVWLPFSTLRERLPKAQAAELERWLRVWTIKGLLAPLCLWIFVNLGLAEYFPPLVEAIQAAHRGWATVAAFLGAMSDGFFIIGSYWAAFTLGWLLRVVEGQIENQREFKRTTLALSAVLVPWAVLLIYLTGTQAAGLAAVCWLYPLVHVAIPLAFKARKTPSYHRAVVKMHGDKYKEAEAEVIAELENSEDDFRGWMMLANLYAHHFDDLAGADRIIRDTCAHEEVTVSEICEGFNALADWHLELARDPVAARSALAEICARYPNTQMAQMAKRRSEQLPATREDYIEKLAPRAIRLPALGKKLDDAPTEPASPEAQKQAVARANECVEKLKKNPDNVAAREELARVLAEQLCKAEPAIAQIELLLNMPAATPEQAAGWLGLMAAWQIRYLNDRVAGRETMERLVRRYPQSGPALAAVARINLMDVEAKARAARANLPAEPKLSIFSRA